VTLEEARGRDWHWLWIAIAAGLCGTGAHLLLMYLKARTGLLPEFQPYQSLQFALARMTGTEVHAAVPWILSWLNGSTVLGFLFARMHDRMPGHSGASRGAAFGVLGWVVMNLAGFPLIGLGPFAIGVGLEWRPALFSLAMMLTYSVVLGVAYSALHGRRR
jgi:hypothetical protein